MILIFLVTLELVEPIFRIKKNQFIRYLERMERMNCQLNHLKYMKLFLRDTDLSKNKYFLIDFLINDNQL